MAENSWGKQPPKKSAYTPPPLSTPSFWGPAPVPPKVITEWEEIWGEDGGAGTAYEGQDSLEVNSEGNYQAGAREQEAGAHDSWVGGEEKRFESEYGVEGTGADGKFQAGARVQEAGAHDSWVGGEAKRFESEYGVEGTGADGKFQAGARESEAGAHDSWVGGEAKRFESEYGVEGTTTSGNFRAVFEGLDPNIEGNFRRLMKGEKPDTSGNFKAKPLGLSDPAEDSEDEATKAKYKSKYKAKGRKSKAAAFSVNPYKASGSFKAQPIAQNKASSYKVIPYSGVDTQVGTFNPSPAPTASGKSDPSPYIGQWNFRVEIDGIPLKNCQFVSVSGVVSETEAISYKFSQDAYMQAMPGVYKFSDVELTRVHKNKSDEFYKWREKIESGKDDMRVVTIHLLNINMNDAPVMTMVLHDAWPIKWEFPELNAGSSDAALEKITFSVGCITKG
jgi:phage tail-like protein